MSDRYRLGGLENDVLLSAVAELVRRENDSLSDLLAHLAELDERGLCLELGYSSLFAYCTQALGFSKSSAGRRIAAARACREYPEAFARIANGDLELSALCAVRQYLNPDNATELFAACSKKSCEQVEELLAALFPKPDVRDLVRRLPERSPFVAPEIEVSGLEVKGPAPDVETMWSPPLVETRTAAASSRRGTVKPLSAERFSVNFTADAEFRQLLEEVRALVSHAEPRGDLMSVMKRGLQALRGELLKKRFGVGRKPRRIRLETRGAASESDSRAAVGNAAPRAASRLGIHEGSKRNRYIAVSVAREVYARDGGRCTFCAQDGRRCGERAMLQFDHVVPHAWGGASTTSNLRLRCRGHNLHTARRSLGKGFTQRAAAFRTCRSEVKD